MRPHLPRSGCGRSLHHALTLLLAFGAAACGSSDPTGSGGTGTAKFTTWGEEYIEQGIPSDPGDGSGFIDGWRVKYGKFLVNFQNITVADASGTLGNALQGSRLFDNTAPGVKSIVDFEDLPAKAWSEVSYEIAPVTADSELGDSATEGDKELMLAGGYSIYVEGVATKGQVTKSYAWGFPLGTRYERCHSEQDGRDESGIVITKHASLNVELTTHGDHLYYDRLQASPDPTVLTSLRFDAIAEADRDADGEVTLEELNAALLDVRRYNPSGLGAATLGAFVTSLARTVGHFRGEGECTISKI